MKLFFTSILLSLSLYSWGQEWNFKITPIANSFALNTPWEVTYGPDDMLWITERAGKRITRIDPETGKRDDLVSIQESHQASTQDGVLGMALHPDLGKGVETDFVYVSYTYLNGGRHQKIVRFTYSITDGDGVLTDQVDVITGLPGSNDHNSGRLVFGPDGKIYYTIGDQGKNQYENVCKTIMAQSLPTQEEVDSQNWSTYQGKILRLNPDGSIPADNPQIDGVQSHIYSYGHRNPQGLVFSETGLLFSAEHGPKSDDELNLIQAGKNYGWPHVAGYLDDKSYSYCHWATSSNCRSFDDYGCPGDATVSKESDWSHPDFVPPIQTFYTVENGYDFKDGNCNGNFICWPTIAPSSMHYYHFENGVPGWDRALLIVSLKRGSIYYVPVNESGEVIGDPVELMDTQNRYRDIAIHPNGKIFYIVTDNFGQTSGPSSSNTSQLDNPGTILKVEYDDTPVEPTLSLESQMEYVTIYPNPASEKLCIRFSSELDQFSKDLRILDMQGKVVLKVNGVTSDTEVDLAGVKSGLYLLQTSVKGIVLTKRLSVIR